LHGVGGQSSQSHGLGVLGHLVLDHVDLLVDLGLGSGAVEVDLAAQLSGGSVSAGLDGLPELMLEALGHDGDVDGLVGGLGIIGGIGLGACIGVGAGICAGVSAGVSAGVGVGLGFAGAGHQSENHHQGMKQSDQF